MARPEKAAAVAEITERFKDASAALLTEYRGLHVGEIDPRRRNIALHLRLMFAALGAVVYGVAGPNPRRGADGDYLVEGEVELEQVEGGMGPTAAPADSEVVRAHFKPRLKHENGPEAITPVVSF